MTGKISEDATVALASNTIFPVVDPNESSPANRNKITTFGAVQSALTLVTATGFALINGKLVVTASASALTIAVKTLANADPSGGDPVTISFRDESSLDGGYDTVSITAATSLIISSGSTLGVVALTAFRLWVVGFNDAGTFRLGVINTRLSTTNVFPIMEGIDSATAEGGAGAADSAGVIYAGVAVTSKAMRIIGFAEWDQNGLATAGTWTTTNLVRLQPFGPGTRKPGEIIQTSANFVTAEITGTTIIPDDGTIPQITEGVQVHSLSFTAKSAANILRMELLGSAWHSAASEIGFAIFRAATSNALIAQMTSSTAALRNSIYVVHSELAASTVAVTYSVRAGGDVAGTLHYPNTTAYGVASYASFRITEIQA